VFLAMSDLNPAGFQSRAHGVGQNSEHEPSVSPVRCTNVRRSDAERWLDSVAQILQVSSGSSKSVHDDVLEEDEGGPTLADDSRDVGPDPSLVGFAELLSGETERLAWESRSDEIHSSTPRSSVERAEVTPDRTRIQPPFTHRLCQ
jgi:hypothetical protein